MHFKATLRTSSMLIKVVSAKRDIYYLTRSFRFSGSQRQTQVGPVIGIHKKTSYATTIYSLICFNQNDENDEYNIIYYFYIETVKYQIIAIDEKICTSYSSFLKFLTKD